MSYLVDKPPSEDHLIAFGARPWESQTPKINYTLSRAAYRPYSTTKAKYSAWEPKTSSRSGSVKVEKDVRE